MEDSWSSRCAPPCQDSVGPSATRKLQLTPEQIRRGLSAIADAVHGQGMNINMIVVGGTVNAMLLRTRQFTTDVDIFFRSKTRTVDTLRVLAAATSSACKGLGLEEGWLNDDVALYVQVSRLLALLCFPS